ncbi:MAG TPA: hypothetical protein VMP86_07710 [Candidatus Binatia bacterium]|nr:hypothetical protein [Candidatus Binatia bacterium]
MTTATLSQGETLTTTTTTTTTSSEELRAQVDDLRMRHEHALERAHELREFRNTAAGARVLGEVDEEELAQANTSLTEAENVAASLASALALVQTRLAEAKEREQEERLVQIADEAKGSDKERAAGRKRVASGLANTSAGFEAIDRPNRTDAQLRSEAVRLRDPERQEEELNERYRARLAELRATAPPGAEPNYVSLQYKFDQELTALREAAKAEAESLAPSAADDALRAIVDAHAALLPRLVDSSTKRALDTGREFISPPRRVSELPRGAIGRHYADSELEAARVRHAAFLAAIDRLAGAATSRSDDFRTARGING